MANAVHGAGVVSFDSLKEVIKHKIELIKAMNAVKQPQNKADLKRRIELVNELYKNWIVFLSEFPYDHSNRITANEYSPGSVLYFIFNSQRLQIDWSQEGSEAFNQQKVRRKVVFINNHAEYKEKCRALPLKKCRELSTQLEVYRQFVLGMLNLLDPIMKEFDLFLKTPLYEFNRDVGYDLVDFGDSNQVKLDEVRQLFNHLYTQLRKIVVDLGYVNNELMRKGEEEDRLRLQKTSKQSHIPLSEIRRMFRLKNEPQKKAVLRALEYSDPSTTPGKALNRKKLVNKLFQTWRYYCFHKYRHDLVFPLCLMTYTSSYTMPQDKDQRSLAVYSVILRDHSREKSSRQLCNLISNVLKGMKPKFLETNKALRRLVKARRDAQRLYRYIPIRDHLGL